MDVDTLIGGVAAGIILAVAFLWCARAANIAEGRPPWWSLLGMLAILAYIGATVVTAESLPLFQTGAESHQVSRASD
jgi:hypothetical protein